MLANNPSILITGEIDEALIQQLTSKGFNVDVIPFIKTESIQSAIIQQEIEHIATIDAIIIFTSSHAVEAISHLLSNKKINWKVYCVGEKTKYVIEHLLPAVSVADYADNAIHLSQKIISTNSINEVYFFCGDKRMDTLPRLLASNNITVHEVQVYTTTIFEYALNRYYDVVLFFSPSAVRGFFTSNTIDEKTALFAIGNTTANEIKRYTSTNIIISEKPGKKELIEKLVEFFE
ncbi:uroporphyrinogen-III synthase [Parafilimonas terrae]|uniref:Uroporphyrinogen-III synthase n=2 Tax=Parafilimonas terrae TaxID=1465490 RepID=A0A1I5USJ7_9BACT|nr:uroporphyrinogen-III synthase [Parafilimonas terrae]